MKKLFKISLFIFTTALFLFAQFSFGQKVKHITDRLSKGDQKIDYHVLKSNNSIKHGPYKEYYKGVLITSGQFDNNKKTGKWIFKDFKNNFNYEGSFVDGKKDGKWIYYSNNNLQSELYYSKNEIDSCFGYINNHLVYEEKFYSDGSGIIRTKYLNGNINEVIHLRNHDKEGVHEIYFQNGQLHRKLIYKQNKLMEVVSTFDANGEPVFGGDIKNGTGTFRQFDIYSTDSNEKLIILLETTHKNGSLNGMAKYYYKNGQIESEGKIKDDNKIGLWKRYNEDGSFAKEINYQSKLMRKISNTVDLNPYSIHFLLNINDSLIVNASFQGGENELYSFIGQNINYPKKAKGMGQSGRVFVTFSINKIGEVYNIDILRGVSEEIDAEVIKIINTMPRWVPGNYLGRPNNIQYRLPIKFSLN